jgi:hypothetical protein
VPDPSKCPVCEQPLTVQGDVATCPRGHRFVCEEIRTTPGDEPHYVLGERLPDE